jgi:glycosyltransferase involved in cell wall biosynthesis
MRVLSVLHYNGFGGPHNRNMRVIPLLKKKGIHTTVLLPNEPGDAAQRLQAAGIETVKMPLGRPRLTCNPVTHVKFFMALPRETTAIRRVIREHGIDLVQINGFGNPQGTIAGKLEGKAVVCQILDIGYPMAYRIVMMSVLKRLADVLMSTGMAVARAHPGAISFGDRLVTFFPPVDTDLFTSDERTRTAARMELGLALDDLVIGTVASLNFQKNHPAFVRAAAELRRTFPKTRFVILGATRANRQMLQAALARQGEKLGLRIGKDLIIRDPQNKVAQLAQAFDVFWLTSRWEGIPTSIEEAMALRVPVVAVDVGSVREAVEDGVSGLVVPPRDQAALIHATIRLVRDPQLRTAIGESARKFAVDRFDVKNCAEVHTRAFRKAMDHSLAHQRENGSSPQDIQVGGAR